MRNQALIWNTDTSLRVTSLTARLRDFAGIGERKTVLHVSDLWDGPIHSRFSPTSGRSRARRSPLKRA